MRKTKTKPASKTNGKTAENSAATAVTLQAAADLWLDHLTQAGKAKNTVGSYASDARLVVAELGADTPVNAITPARLGALLASPRVTHTALGVPKAPVSASKTRRAVAQFFAWAAEQGWTAGTDTKTNHKSR